MFRKKVLALVMAICLSVSYGLIANAQTLELSRPNEKNCELEFVDDEAGIITPFWTYINDTLTVLSISDSGIATCTSKITGYSGSTTKVHITMTLQKKGGFLNLFWTDVMEWSQSFNNYYGTLSKTHSTSGGTYRIRAVYVAYSGSDSETTTAYSSEVKH